MSVTKRSIHIALYHSKYRVRKKNKHRVTRLIKSGFNRRTFDIEGCLGIANNIVFHEYEQPENRYIEVCKEEGLI